MWTSHDVCAHLLCAEAACSFHFWGGDAVRVCVATGSGTWQLASGSDQCAPPPSGDTGYGYSYRTARWLLPVKYIHVRKVCF